MLYQHQINARDFAIRNGGSIALFHDPGLGKTRTALEIYGHYKKQYPQLRMLVVCPLSLINAAWGVDTAKFTNFKYSAYTDITPREMPDIIGINFESLIVEKRFKEIQSLLAAGNWMLVVDESSRMKNHKSITTKALLRLAAFAKIRIVASGTPAPNSEMEFWAQAKFVRPTCLPDSFYQFRNSYFYLGRGNQVIPVQGRVLSRGMMAELFQKGFKYICAPAQREAIMDRLAPFTHWVKQEDAIDLPDKVDEIRSIRLNPNEKKVYNDMKHHLVAEIKTGRQLAGKKEIEQITAEVALAKLMKLRQATSGFLYNEEHEARRPGKSSKMRELEYLLEELGPRQVIIWIQFHEEVKAISEVLKDKTFTTLYAGTPDKDQAIKDFQEGRAQYLIANPHSAAHGLTFVNCNTAIFFSLDYSYEAHTQARGRIYRIGQQNKCLYVYLIAEKSIDGMILEVLNRKKSLQELLYELVQEED